MKIIHDNIWGDMEFSDLAISIIDTPVFQRLHDIKQNGMAFRVFPTVKTTRFEHSLGVYFITKLFIYHLTFDNNSILNDHDKELICISGLVHDIGHGPFSHWFDYILNNYQLTLNCDWNDHENRSCDLFKYLVHNFDINLNNDDIIKIQSYIKGNGNFWFEKLIHNQDISFDMDKIDYLLRDIHAFGFHFKFDPFRILRNSKIIKDKICFCNSIKDEIISIFLLRNKLKHQIYNHPKIIYFENIAMNFVKEFISHNIHIITNKNCSLFITWTDSLIYTLLLQSSFWKRHFHIIHDNNLTSTKNNIDDQWLKIKKIPFYDKKNINEYYFISDWNCTSCFL